MRVSGWMDGCLYCVVVIATPSPVWLVGDGEFQCWGKGLGGRGDRGGKVTLVAETFERYISVRHIYVTTRANYRGFFFTSSYGSMLTVLLLFLVIWLN